VLVAVAAAALAVGGAACDGDGAVALSFQPAVGTELAYRTDVESTTVTDVPCQPFSRRTERTRIDSTQQVLDVGDDGGVRVQVELSRRGTGTRTVVVRFDRAAQLTTVESVEGIPASSLGDLGLSDIFPPAAGAPPDRPLAPGDRWEVDDEIRLDGDGGEPTRLRGEGRLVALGVVDGSDTATIETRTELPVSTTTSTASGTRSLDGEQVTDVTATYDVDDGALRRASSVTTGTFDLDLTPPPGGSGDPCNGTLLVRVRSEVRRR
jgi:hypothetical protein